jgi:hypothetical protein
MVCVRCGAQNPVGALLCARCRFPLALDRPETFHSSYGLRQSGRAPSTVSAQRRRSWGRIAFIVVGMFIFTLTVIFVWGFYAGSDWRAWLSTGFGVPNGSGNDSVAARDPGIGLLLNRWTESLRRHDLDSHINCYGPVLERYFRRTNVAREVVRADKRRAFLEFSSLKVRLTGVSITAQSQDRAVIEFQKSWDFERLIGKPFVGSDQERLVVIKGSAGWMITSETEVHAR